MRILRQVAAGFIALALMTAAHAADEGNSADVHLDATTAQPRAVEPLTSERIRRDYGQAWANLAKAFNGGNAESLGNSFTGPARDNLVKAIREQQQSGVHSRYMGQSHKLAAIFYAPEGDVMELHDTATCDLQVLDGANVIHNEHVTVNYIALMTPGAEGWLVRQLQAVPAF